MPENNYEGILMNPDEPTTPPSAPEPETNPVPPPEPQPEPAAEPPAQEPQPAGSELPSAFSLFKPSWEALKLNLGTFIALYAIPFALGIVVFGIGGFAGSSADSDIKMLEGVSLIGVLALIVIGLIIAPASTYTQVKSVQGEHVSIGQAFSGGMRVFWRYWGAMILAGLLIFGGFLLLIVPGLFMLKRYFLVPYAVFTENAGVMDTLKKSAAATKGRGMAVFGVLGVTILISLVGIIPILGWIASIIGSLMYYCAPAVRWSQLRKLAPPSSVKA